MGNGYTHLPTQDPSELHPSSTRTEADISKLQKLTTWFTPNIKISRSSSEIREKHPIIRAPVHTDAIGALATVRPGIVLSGGRDKLIALNNTDTGKCLLRWHGHEKEVTKIGYQSTFAKHFILSGSRDSQIRLWKFDSPNTLRIFLGHQMSIAGLAMVDQMRFISGARDATLRLWDLETGTCLCAAHHSRNLVTHISHCSMNNLLAQSSEDKQLKIWDSRNLCLAIQFPKKNHILTHCDFLPDGNYCITSSNGFNNDGCEITLWDIRQQKMMLEYRGHEESVNCAIFLRQQVISKRVLLSVSADRTARLWNIDDGGCLWSELIPTASDLLACVGFSDGNIVVSGLNATLCNLRILNRAARPYLQCISVQSLT
ncbi:WD domain, G-beta repeat protein [Onchocerca flexuosa]|uniref:WD domain, G-beta repeat protein n=1 Tax=Onchocerca flexuosa TaxID=387005 RepID=A0A238C349_9BILA|nr:WD domain, G-beta repeat protein [Onchocerca flexuosa]